ISRTSPRAPASPAAFVLGRVPSSGSGRASSQGARSAIGQRSALARRSSRIFRRVWSPRACRRALMRSLWGVLMTSADRQVGRQVSLAVKRALDIVVAALGLVLLSPLLLLIAVAIATTL